MIELNEELAGMGAPLTDTQYSAYIAASLPPSYRPLLTTMRTAARLSDKPFTSSTLIKEICEEADQQAVHGHIDNAAMVVTAEKGKRRGKAPGNPSLMNAGRKGEAKKVNNRGRKRRGKNLHRPMQSRKTRTSTMSHS